MPETINHPPHYTAGRRFEPIDVIEDWRLGFCDGDVVKYLSRWRSKGGIEDPQHAEAMADFLRELEGWKDGPNSSDDTIRKHWQMRRAAATLRALAADLAVARAEAAGLREALEEIAEERDAGRHDGLPEPCPAHDADTMFALARNALSATPASDPRVPGLRAALVASDEIERVFVAERAWKRMREWLRAELARLGAREGA